MKVCPNRIICWKARLFYLWHVRTGTLEEVAKQPVTFFRHSGTEKEKYKDYFILGEFTTIVQISLE